MTRELLVFIEGRYAGSAKSASIGDVRRVTFRYDDSYSSNRTPLSLRIPVKDREYEISRWLDGLLPDRESVRIAWAEQHDAESEDPISILSTPVGLDCAGAVQFCPPGEEETVHHRSDRIEWHDHDEIAEWIRSSRQGEEQTLGSLVRHSLGGWQSKVALHREGDRWGTPVGSHPTTWILKPGIDPRVHQKLSWPDSDLIEHVTMSAARHLDLDVAHTTVERFAGERVLAVRRYDRHMTDDGRWHRSHQEDFCQALNYLHDKKYQQSGGPSPEQIVRAIRSEASTPEIDVAHFVDSLIFSWAAGCMDGHAKNYSVLLLDDIIHLAPLYDLMTDIPYQPSGRPVFELKTAMKIGAGYRLQDADRRNVWEAAALRFDLDSTQLADRAADILDRCPDAFEQAINSLDPIDQNSPRLDTLIANLRQRRNSVLTKIGGATHRSQSRLTPRTVLKPPSHTITTHDDTNLSSVPDSPQISDRSVVCGYPTGVNQICRRSLRTSVCPHHPESSGSIKILSRNKHRNKQSQSSNDPRNV